MGDREIGEALSELNVDNSIISAATEYDPGTRLQKSIGHPVMALMPNGAILVSQTRAHLSDKAVMTLFTCHYHNVRGACTIDNARFP